MRDFILDNIRKIRNDILVLACNIKIVDATDMENIAEKRNPTMTSYTIPDSENYKSSEYLIYEDLLATVDELEKELGNLDEVISKLVYTKSDIIGDNINKYISKFNELHAKLLKYESIIPKNLNKFIIQLQEAKDQLFINESIIRRVYHFFASIEFLDESCYSGMKEWLCDFSNTFRNGQYAVDAIADVSLLLKESIRYLNKAQDILLAVGYNTDIRGASPEYIRIVSNALNSSIDIEQKNYDLENSLYPYVKLEKYITDEISNDAIDEYPVKLYPCVHNVHQIDPKCGYKRIGDEIDISQCAYSECETCRLSK